MPESAQVGVTKDIELYRDATRWIVTLATGSVVVGLGLFKDADVGTLARWTFSIASVALLVSIVSGVHAHLWIISYVGHHEESIRRTGSDSEKSNAKARAALKKGDLAYRILLYSFMIGLVAFACFGLIHIWEANAASPCPAAR